MSSIKPHLDRLTKALDAFGFKHKRAQALEIASRALGYRNSNELVAAANKGDLNPPTAKLIGTITVENQKLAILADPVTTTPFAVLSASGEIAASPYSGFVRIPSLEQATLNFLAAPTIDNATAAFVFRHDGTAPNIYIDGKPSPLVNQLAQACLSQWLLPYETFGHLSLKEEIKGLSPRQIIETFFEKRTEFRLEYTTIYERGKNIAPATPSQPLSSAPDSGAIAPRPAAASGTLEDAINTKMQKLADHLKSMARTDQDDKKASFHCQISISDQQLDVFEDPTTKKLFAVPAEISTLEKPKRSRPIVRPFLDICTCHVRMDTMKWLETQGTIAATYEHTGDAEPVINIGKTMYGWWIWVGEVDSPTAFGDNIPNDLINVLAFARAAKADYVMFDCDGPEYDELPRFAW